MPLLLPFKRAGLHEKVFQAAAYPAVILLAFMVLIPFSMMIALSFGDVTDAKAGRKWPSFRHLVSPSRLYIHYLATRYDYWIGMYGFDDRYGVKGDGKETILDLERVPELKGSWRARAEDAHVCIKTRLDPEQTGVLFSAWFYWVEGKKHALAGYTGLSDRAWQKSLLKRYGSIARINDVFGAEYVSLAYVKTPGLPGPNDRGGQTGGDRLRQEFRVFVKEELPVAWRLPHLGNWAFRVYLQGRPQVDGKIENLNRLLGTSFTSWGDIRLARALPADPVMARVWESYVREQLSPYFIEIADPGSLAASYRAFLLSRHSTEEVVRVVHGMPLERIELASRAREIGKAPAAFADWDEFIRRVPLDRIKILTVEEVWEKFLEEKYRTVTALNSAHGAAYAGFAGVPWPQAEVDRADWEDNRGRYVFEVLFKNYRRVWTLMTDSAPAIFNTLRFAVVFTLLAVLVDTAAAYALSRFNFGVLQMSLVFFLALAAFPLEAIAVPNFILLKKFGMLNSVWALVLPTVLNGYYIYLLKSHFDSIPRSFVEGAVMEGAGEWRLFWMVSLPAVRPMMAVVALYAFLWSYSNFIWALIVCQQRTQWTMPVLLFNMNNWCPITMVAAAQVLAVIPPLLVFAVAHGTLQRSLSLPR